MTANTLLCNKKLTTSKLLEGISKSEVENERR